MHKYSIKVLEPTEYELWDHFVNECENSTVFHLSTVLNPLGKYSNCTFEIHALLNNENKIIAGFPLLSRSKLNYFKIVYYPPLIPFYGIIINEKKTAYTSKNIKYKHEIYRYFIKHLSSHFNYVKLNFPITENDIRPFQWSGFNTNVHYTFTQSLKNITAIYDHFDADVRRRIKKAEDQPFNIETTIDRSTIQVFFDLQHETFQRQKIQSPLNKNTFIEYILSLHEAELIKMFTLRIKEKAVASFIYLVHKNVAYYWMAGSKPEFHKEGVNQYLFWKSIENLSQEGVIFFDFVGAATPSVAEYKATYNFALTAYYGAEKSFDPLTNVLLKLKG